jgi:serine/threonine protein phosphatase PrpC
MNVEVAARTDKGMVRSRNEDHYYVDRQRGIFIVCDGLGGHMAGDVASAKAIEFAVRYLESRWEQIDPLLRGPLPDSAVDSRGFVESAIQQASRQLVEFGRTAPHFNGMATTMTLLLAGSHTVLAGHVGDSRLYLEREGLVRQMTRDHTLLAELKSRSPEWQHQHDRDHTLRRMQNVLTRCLGRRSPPKVDTICLTPRSGDVLLLCTKGLSQYLAAEDDVLRLLQAGSVQAMSERLFLHANRCGGEDNITAIVIRLQDTGDGNQTVQNVTQMDGMGTRQKTCQVLVTG